MLWFFEELCVVMSYTTDLLASEHKRTYMKVRASEYFVSPPLLFTLARLVYIYVSVIEFQCVKGANVSRGRDVRASKTVRSIVLAKYSSVF